MSSSAVVRNNDEAQEVTHTLAPMSWSHLNRQMSRVGKLLVAAVDAIAERREYSRSTGIATFTKSVKRWQGGSMVVRWTCTAIVEAEKKFRRVQGWKGIDQLIAALEHLETDQEAATEQVA